MVKGGYQMCMSWTQVTSLLSGFSVFFYSVIVTGKMLYLIGVRLDCKVLCFVKQCHLSGGSCQCLDHCRRLDVAIQLLWWRKDCLSMVAEVTYDTVTSHMD
jgi:hypothetical protein